MMAHIIIYIDNKVAPPKQEPVSHPLHPYHHIVVSIRVVETGCSTQNVYRKLTNHVPKEKILMFYKKKSIKTLSIENNAIPLPSNNAYKDQKTEFKQEQTNK